jgi:hypothetical protein
MVQMDQSIYGPLVLKFDPYDFHRWNAVFWWLDPPLLVIPPRQRIYINEATCSVMYLMFSHDSINFNELVVAWNYPQP